MTVLRVFAGLAAALLLTMFSYFYLDVPVAVFFHHLAMSDAMLRKYTSHIPDLLFPIAVMITVCCWTALLVWAPKGIHGAHARFLQLCGVSVPLAYAAKCVLQHIFGRVDPRVWIYHHWLAGFHWFHDGAGFASFPSGHMTVFAALAAVLWRHYPRYRIVYGIGAVALGVALVATDYHFVSDVVSGAYLGIMVCYVCDAVLVAVAGSYRGSGPTVAPGPAVRIGH